MYNGCYWVLYHLSTFSLPCHMPLVRQMVKTCNYLSLDDCPVHQYNFYATPVLSFFPSENLNSSGYFKANSQVLESWPAVSLAPSNTGVTCIGISTLVSNCNPPCPSSLPDVSNGTTDWNDREPPRVISLSIVIWVSWTLIKFTGNIPWCTLTNP